MLILSEAKSIMLKTSNMVYKTLVIGVIILFCGISVQPCIAIVQKELPKEAKVEQDDYNYLANLSMDFGENITNDRIEYKKDVKRVQGDWTFNVKINFSCPENLKIIVRYEYFICLVDLVVDEPVFNNIYIKDTVTIINGSNPPDIDIDYTKFIGHRGGNELLLTLRIKANLTVYEFLDGEWVLIDSDDTFKEIKEIIYFMVSRYIEIFVFIEGDGEIEWLCRRGLFRGFVNIKCGENNLTLTGLRYDKFKKCSEKFSTDVKSVKTRFFFGYSTPIHSEYDNYVKGWAIFSISIYK